MYATSTAPAGVASRIDSSSMVQASGQTVTATPVDLTPHQMLVRSDLVSYFALGGAVLGLAIGIMNKHR